MDETLVGSCHRAVLAASVSHPSSEGFDLLLHPALRSMVEAYEAERGFLLGSFGTLAGARRVVYTAAAGESFAVFCRAHGHRLDLVIGAAGPADA